MRTKSLPYTNYMILQKAAPTLLTKKWAAIDVKRNQGNGQWLPFTTF